MNKKTGITIVTFYENDKEDLLSLYNSINSQTYNNWEWIIFFDDSYINKKHNFFDNSKIKYKNIKNINKILLNLKSELILFVEPFVSLNREFLESIYISQKETIFDGIYFALNVDKNDNENKNEYNIDRRIFSFSLSISQFSNNFNEMQSYSFLTIINKLLLRIENQIVITAAENFLIKSPSYKSAMMKKNLIFYPISDNVDFDSLPYKFDYGDIIKKEKKRLLFVFPWLVIGGADKFNLDFLTRLDEKTYDVTIILTRQSKHEWKHLFSEIPIVKEIFDVPAFLPRISWAGFFDYIMRTRDIDLVFFSNSIYGYHIIPWLKSYYPKIPFVDFLHAEDWFWKKGGLPRDSIAVSKFIDITYSCTNHLVEVMTNKMEKKVNNDKVAYIGVDPYYYDREKINIKEYKKVEKYVDKKIITYVCRLVHLKRPFFILEVLKKLVDIDCSYVLFVVGDGPLYKEMIHRAKKMNLTDNIVFWGACEDVRPYYYVSNVTVVCSLTEGLALVSYESMSMEVPVISSNVGGQSELIDEKVGAIINNYQDYKIDLFNYNYDENEVSSYVKAIENIVNNKNISEIRKLCRDKIINGFSIQKAVDKISSDFLDLIEKGSSIDVNLCNNLELHERYLVIYNEASKFYKSPKLFGSALITENLWQSPIYRKIICFFQKIGVIKIIKKILRR